jgi:hypothetical protein
MTQALEAVLQVHQRVRCEAVADDIKKLKMQAESFQLPRSFSTMFMYPANIPAPSQEGVT